MSIKKELTGRNWEGWSDRGPWCYVMKIRSFSAKFIPLLDVAGL